MSSTRFTLLWAQRRIDILLMLSPFNVKCDAAEPHDGVFSSCRRKLEEVEREHERSREEEERLHREVSADQTPLKYLLI